MDATRLKPCLTPFVLILSTSRAFAFEHTRVLPKGVRNIDIRTVNTDLVSKTNAQGDIRPLADPLRQDLTFAKIAKDEAPIRSEQLKAFLLANDFGLDEALGSFNADLKGHLTVTAPIMSYGITDKLTVAVAIPYYKAQTAINVGFVPNQTAKNFLLALSDPKNNQTASAQEAALKLNDAVSRLNQKLLDHDFKALQDWSGAGIGDTTIAAKYRAVAIGPLSLATTGGIVAPTGQPDDPSILTDVSFGDGQWDTFGQIVVDESLPFAFSLNQYAKYTAQLPGQKPIREVTADEKIDVAQKNVSFKLGDRVDSGFSLIWEPRFGLVAGVGTGFVHKFSDVYVGVEENSKAELEKNTESSARTAEWTLGYSTVPLYQDGLTPVPFEIRLSETKILASRNTPVTDLFQIDINLFF
jgi:hypothetical protein